MIEYTLGVVITGFLIGILDVLLQTHLITRPHSVFWKTAGAFLVFQLIFDNLFTYWGLWSFNSVKTLGVFVPFVPIENLVFGLEMLLFCLIIYEKQLGGR